MKAFVLGLSENGYGILRALTREHVPVVGFYRSKSSFGRFSRRCPVHPLEANEDGLWRALLQKARCVADKPVLFPTSDDQVAALIRDQEGIKDHFLYHWLPPPLCRNIVDKTWMYDAAKNAGVLVPKTHITTENEDVQAQARRFVFPAIVKPMRSHETRFPSGMKNYVAHSVEDLVGFYRDAPSALGATMWQEIVVGGDDRVFQCNVLVRRNGELGAHVCVRKLRQYLPRYGVMCFGRSERNDAILNESLKLLQSLDYRGLASLEFKRSARDERYYFIEMNPRLPWYNSLFPAVGVNLAWLAYLDLTTETIPDAGRQRDYRHWVAFRQDLGHELHERSSPIQWLLSLARARSWAWWDPRDPMPFCYATLDFIRYGLNRVLRLDNKDRLEG